jgi:hypothetical protein
MPSVTIEHNGLRLERALNGRLSIGRLPICDVVIDHPTVSRTHATIETRDGEFLLIDSSSRNGVIVAGERIDQRHQLNHGDCIEIGPARLTFCADTSPTPSPASSTSTDSAHDTAIVFSCACGARLWMPASAVGRVVVCRKCRAKVRCEEPSPGPAPNEVCGICQWRIESSESHKTCPSCGLTFHAECWTENRGCSAYGCSHVGVMETKHDPVVEVPIAEEVGRPPQRLDAPAAAPPLPSAPVPLGHLLLGASIVAAVVGVVLFGVPSVLLVLLMMSGWIRYDDPGHWRTGTIALLVSIVGAITGIAVSRIWWQG